MTKTTIAPTKIAYRVKFVIDPDAQFEESNGEPRPLTAREYRGNQYRGCPRHPRSKVPPRKIKAGLVWCGECGRAYEDLPYAEYRAYYGNPERHVYLGCIVERQCGSCQSWVSAASLWNIDTMDDDPAYRTLAIDHWLTVDDATQLPSYLGEVARELLAEAQTP